MPYAIARIAKLKRQNIAGSASHCARTRLTPNADPTVENIRFIGSDDPNEKLEDLVLNKINPPSQKRKIRPDAVWCVELLLTASPKYFRPDNPTHGGYYDPTRMKEWLTANQQYLNQTWGERIVRAELHLDEMTPHIHAYLVPLDSLGQLNCKSLFGGREKMRRFQDDYHAAVQHLGLERGIKGSLAQHQDMKDFYQIVNEGRDLETEGDPELLRAKAADRERALQKLQEMEQTASSLAQRVEQLEATNSKLKKLADQLRDLPLEEVAWHLGQDIDSDKNRWKGRYHNINIDGCKFYDFSTSRGGGGSIDLVMHIRQCPYKEALAWLNERFGSEGMLGAVTHHARLEAIFLAQTSFAPKFKPPQPEESQWERVRDYLLSKRKLPDYLIDSLHRMGAIYADSSQNAVFLMRTKEREVGGAFLCGTAGGNDNQLMGYADNTLRHSSWFVFQRGKSEGDPVERVVILQSPIDALSFAALDRTQQEKRTLYLVADGRRQLPMDYLFDKEVVVAYSREGDEKALEIKQLIPHASRHRPRGEDWNADLQELYLKEPPQHQQKSKHPSSLELD
ncbi:MAG TPA: MobV family relaxase [Oculatellaceae cyanobacterium]